MNIAIQEIVYSIYSYAPPIGSILKKYMRVYLYAWSTRFIIEQPHPSEGISDSTVVSTLGFYFLIYFISSYVEKCSNTWDFNPIITLVTHNILFNISRQDILMSH